MTLTTRALLLRGKTLVDLNPTKEDLSLSEICHISYIKEMEVTLVKPKVGASYRRRGNYVPDINDPSSEYKIPTFDIISWLFATYGEILFDDDKNDVIYEQSVYLAEVDCKVPDGQIDPALLIVITPNHYLTVCNGVTNYILDNNDQVCDKTPYHEFLTQIDYTDFVKIIGLPYILFEEQIFLANHENGEAMGLLPSRFVKPTDQFLDFCKYMVLPSTFLEFSSRKNPLLNKIVKNTKNNKKFDKIQKKYFDFQVNFPFPPSIHFFDICVWNNAYTLGLRSGIFHLSNDKRRYVKMLYESIFIALGENGIMKYFEDRDGSIERLLHWVVEGFEPKDFPMKECELKFTKGAFPKLPHAQSPSWFQNFTGMPTEDLGEMANRFNNLIDQAHNVFANVKSGVKDILPRALCFLFCVALAYGLIKFCFYKDSTLLVQLGIVSVGIIFFFPEELKALIMSALKIGQLPVAQSDNETPWDLITRIVTMATAFFAGFDLKNFKFKVKDIIPAISSLPRLEKGIKYAMDALSDIIQSVMNYIRDKFYGLHPVFKDNTGIEKVDSFLRQATPVIEKSWSAQPPYRLSDYEKIIHLQFLGGQLLMVHSFGDRESDVSVKKIISSVMTMLEKIRRPYDASSLRAKFTRCEPIVIVLTGKPGQGKSYFGSMLAKMIVKQCVPGAKEDFDKNESSYIYTRAPETVYWDGYAGQYVTMLDDLGQSTDTAGQPDSEYMNFIRMVNTFQSPLHMAEMSQKANTFFQSKFVIVTTNHESFNGINSIHFVEAFKRRFDIVLEVTANPAYKTTWEELTSMYNFDELERKGEWIQDPDHPLVDLDNYDPENVIFTPFDSEEGLREYEIKTGKEPRTIYAKKHATGSYMLNIRNLQPESVKFNIKDSFGEEGKLIRTVNIVDLMDHIIKVYTNKTMAFEESLKFAENIMDHVYENVPKGFETVPPLEMFTLDHIAEGHSKMRDDLSDGETSDEYEEPDELSADGEEEMNFGYYYYLCRKKMRQCGTEFRKRCTEFYDYALSPGSKFFERASEVMKKTPQRVSEFLANLFVKHSADQKQTETAIGMYRGREKSYLEKTMQHIRIQFNKIKERVGQYIYAIHQRYPGISAILWITANTVFSTFIFAFYFTCVAWFAKFFFELFGLTQKKQQPAPNNHPQTSVGNTTETQSGNAKREVKGSHKVMKYKRMADGRFEPDYDSILVQSPDDGEVIKNPIVNKILNKNSIIIKRHGETKAWANATIITGSIAMIPTHYFYEANATIAQDPESAYAILDMYTYNGVLFKQTTLGDFASSENYSVENNDLTLFLIPGRLKTFPDIRKHFIRDEDLPSSYIDIVLLCLDHEETPVHVTEAIMSKKDMHYVNSKGKKLMVNRSFSYRADTAGGDCGNLIFANDTRFFPAPIMGMHIAGTTGNHTIGFSNVVTREIIEDTLQKFDKLELNSPPIEEFKYAKESKVDFVHKEFRCAAVSELNLGMATKTAITPTIPIYGIFGECPTAPAILAPYKQDGVLIDPLTTATLKYQKTAPHIPKELLEAVTDDLIHDLLSNSTEFKYRKLTFEESIAGVPGVKFIDGISRKTSAGFPYCKLKPPGGKGKQTLFGKVGDYEFDSEDAIKLKKDVEEIEQAARMKKRMIHIYGDFLKDELRPKHKVKNPRLVSCAPVEFTVAYRKLLLPLHAWFMENRVKNGFAVGVNPWNEWGKIVTHLQMNDGGDSLIAGDFKGFDTQINSAFEGCVAKVFKSIMKKEIEEDPEIANMIDVYLMEIFSSVHIFKNNIYYWTCGQPSGNPATTFINCIVNRLLIRMCWVVCNDRKLASVKDFRDNVKDVVYGDDNVISVHERARSIFNPISITQAMLEFNMIYTSEEKDRDIIEFRNFSQVSFLKKSFKFDDKLGIFIAPLDMNTVRYMMYHHRKSKNYKQNIQMTFESFLDELSLHDEEEYYNMYNVLAPIMEKEFGYTARVTDHQERRLKTLGNKLVY